MSDKSILTVLAFAAMSFASPGLAQAEVTCATLAAAASLSAEEQRGLGMEAVEKLAEIMNIDPVGAEALRTCVKAAPKDVIEGFREAAANPPKKDLLSGRYPANFLDSENSRKNEPPQPPHAGRPISVSPS